MKTRMNLLVLVLVAVAWGAPASAADGDLDLTFGGGVRHSPIQSFSFDPAAVAIQSDGRMVLCSADAETQHLYLIRFEVSGELDGSFGSGGLVETNIPVTMGSRVKMAIRPDDKIVLAGHALPAHDLFVMQFTPTGVADASFGVNGYVLAGIYTDDDSGFDLAITTRENIILAGIDAGTNQAFLLKIANSGWLDPDFGTSGVAYSGVLTDRDDDVAIDTFSGGGIFLANVSASSGHLFAMRFDWQGNIVPDFGVGGISEIDIYCGIRPTVALKIDSRFHINLGSNDDAGHELFAARLGEWGAPDEGFGDGGVVRTGIPSGIINTMELGTQADGGLLIAGKDPSSPDFFVCRFDSLGLPDGNFGEAGISRLGMSLLDDVDVALALYPDDSFLLAGQDMGKDEAFVARFTADGQLDQTGFPGPAYPDLGHVYYSRVATILQPGGGVIRAGMIDGYSSSYYLQRLDSRGLRDQNFWLGGTRVLDEIHGRAEGAVALAEIPGSTDFYLAGYDEWESKLFVRRFHQDGSDDASFNGGLPVYIPMAVYWFDDVSILALAGGEVLLAGMANPTSEHFVVGLRPNGALDPNFGVDGILMTNVRGGAESGIELMIADYGYFLLAGMDNDPDQAYMMRFDLDGTNDTYFGNDGIAHSGVQSTTCDRIDVGLALTDSGPVLASYCRYGSDNGEIYLAGFSTDGVLNPGFGVGGISLTGQGMYDWVPLDIGVQSDRKIVLAGALMFGGMMQNVFMRFDPAGNLDTGFGIGGVAPSGIETRFHAGVSLEIQEDGNLLAGGHDNARREDYVVRVYATPGSVSQVPEIPAPSAPALVRNFPNPFNPGTTILYEVPKDGHVTLGVYDVRGAHIRTLMAGESLCGSHLIHWDGRDGNGRAVSSGSYFARLQAGPAVSTVRMSLVR